MSRAGCWVPFVVTMLSCAGGASLLVVESSLSRTPEMIRTVALASTATGRAAPLPGPGVAIVAAAAANQSIMRCVTRSVHNGKHRFKDCAIVDQFHGGRGGIARRESLCYGARLASAGSSLGRPPFHDVRSWRNW